MIDTDLDDAEIADIVRWPPDEAVRIRKVYVDHNAVVVALGERIQTGHCKPQV